jgi:Beta-propeller repeat
VFSPSLIGGKNVRLLALLTACSIFAAPDVSPRVKWANLPLSFEPTAEQSTAGVHYLARGSSYSLYLAAGESVLMGKDRSPLRTKLAGANLAAPIVAEGPQTSTSNYFVGKDPRQWRTSVPNYDRVRYMGIYPGIDLVYYGHDGSVEYDWIVSPGADAHQIRMVFQGADRLRIDKTGDLVVTLGKNQYRHRKPVVYQEVAGKRVQVAGAWNLRGKEGSFCLGGYDHEKPLTIDPTLAYSTYLGGSNLDFANAVAVDPAGNTYITGSAGSTDFPTTSPLQASRDGQGDAFVTKLNANGTAKIYSTYLGGGGVDEGYGIAVDSAGNAYVTGSANSLDFPTKNAIQSNLWRLGRRLCGEAERGGFRAGVFDVSGWQWTGLWHCDRPGSCGQRVRHWSYFFHEFPHRESISIRKRICAGRLRHQNQRGWISVGVLHFSGWERRG